MKIIYSQLLFVVCIVALSELRAGQGINDVKKPLRSRDQKHGHSHSRPHHKHHFEGKMNRERKNVLFESFNKEQQAVYNEMHDLQRNIRKNMYALGQERRSLKNVTTGDARKILQGSINKICNEIKQNIEEHQPRIIEAVDALP